MPPTWLREWAGVVSDLAPIPIAIAAAYIAYSQWILARAKLKADLLDRRFSYRKGLASLLSRTSTLDEVELLETLETLMKNGRTLYRKRALKELGAGLSDCREAVRLRQYLDDPFWADQRDELVSSIARHKLKVEGRLVALEADLDRETHVV